MLVEMETATAPDMPGRCILEHRAFHSFGEVLFRRSEDDGTPVMALSLGEREAAVPLCALQRALAIPDDSADGRMLGLIAQALGFVAGLQVGDTLPAEVLDGGASWAPEPAHRAIAAARLRLRLAAWLCPEAAGGTVDDAAVVCRLDEDPAVRAQMHTALEQAARALGLAGATDVLKRVEDLAEELAYVEALRERLLARVRAMVARVERIGGRGHTDRKRLEVLTQVRRLSAAALGQIADRFDELDARTAEVLEALGDVDGQRSFIRSTRDWLYRLSRAWAPILAEWDEAGGLPDGSLWTLVNRTYRFLAPRYMAVQEWCSFVALHRRGRQKPIGAVMKW